MASEQELADLERMSSEYVPDVKGPLIGALRSTQVLVSEYAHADPVYVHKTMALPAKFSHYRTVIGDGNCGWRALAFGYFETLVRLNDPAKVRTEIARLRGDCERLLDPAGFDTFLYEDMTECSFQLLEETAASLPNHDGGASLLASFNDENISRAITYHFRLLTSAWMKMNPEVYAGFLPGIDVNTYCAQTLEPPAVELDNVGLQALATSVINEAGMSIEVLYLDRSEGEEVNAHRLPVLDIEKGSPVEGAPTIRLLYRPGHYDLLYKSEDIVGMAVGAHSNLEVRHVTEPMFPSFQTVDFSRSDDLEAYFMDLPCFTYGTPMTADPPSISQDQGQPSPIPIMPSPTKKISSKLGSTALDSPAPENKSHKVKRVSSPSSETTTSTTENMFRFVGFALDYRDCHSRIRSEQAQAGVTDDNPDMTQKEDKAHFTNEKFQPVMWHPNTDDKNGVSGRRSS